MSTPVGNISQITLPNGDTYNIKDTVARNGSGPTLDLVWEDVYSDWQAGYYYNPDDDYAYTQISSSETIWGETTMRIAVSCTPYSNLI